LLLLWSGKIGLGIFFISKRTLGLEFLKLLWMATTCLFIRIFEEIIIYWCCFGTVGTIFGLGIFFCYRGDFGFEVLDGCSLVQKGGLKEGRKDHLLLLLQNWIWVWRKIWFIYERIKVCSLKKSFEQIAFLLVYQVFGCFNIYIFGVR